VGKDIAIEIDAEASASMSFVQADETPGEQR
jgi:hypothetical protein